MLKDNKVLIGNGRQVAVTIHRLKNLDEGAKNFTMDVQVLKDGKRDLDNVLSTTYKKLRKVYQSLRDEDPCDAVKSVNTGMVEIEIGKRNSIRLKEREIYEALVRARKKV